MKTQLSGWWLFVSCSIVVPPCPFVAYTALRDFKDKRENGEDKDDPIYLSLDYDGKYTWIKGKVKGDDVYGIKNEEESQKRGYDIYDYEVRYDAGPKDITYFEAKDRNYLTRILKEGNLRKEEPAVWYLFETDNPQNLNIADWWSQKLKLPTDKLDSLLKDAEVEGKGYDQKLTAKKLRKEQEEKLEMKRLEQERIRQERRLAQEQEKAEREEKEQLNLSAWINSFPTEKCKKILKLNLPQQQELMQRVKQLEQKRTRQGKRLAQEKAELERQKAETEAKPSLAIPVPATLKKEDIKKQSISVLPNSDLSLNQQLVVLDNNSCTELFEQLKQTKTELDRLSTITSPLNGRKVELNSALDKEKANEQILREKQTILNNDKLADYYFVFLQQLSETWRATQIIHSGKVDCDEENIGDYLASGLVKAAEQVPGVAFLAKILDKVYETVSYRNKMVKISAIATFFDPSNFDIIAETLVRQLTLHLHDKIEALTSKSHGALKRAMLAIKKGINFITVNSIDNIIKEFAAKHVEQLFAAILKKEILLPFPHKHPQPEHVPILLKVICGNDPCVSSTSDNAATSLSTSSSIVTSGSTFFATASISSSNINSISSPMIVDPAIKIKELADELAKEKAQREKEKQERAKLQDRLEKMEQRVNKLPLSINQDSTISVESGGQAQMLASNGAFANSNPVAIVLEKKVESLDKRVCDLAAIAVVNREDLDNLITTKVKSTSSCCVVI